MIRLTDAHDYVGLRIRVKDFVYDNEEWPDYDLALNHAAMVQDCIAAEIIFECQKNIKVTFEVENRLTVKGETALMIAARSGNI